ncbi:hypothetical protein RKLH11_1717 [Rhodobacteraceae bacterium KLH11]|nr:hypothetical protein RKLH11_1717 [Rhodobacteraceae bacterium KLH11]
MYGINTRGNQRIVSENAVMGAFNCDFILFQTNMELPIQR